MTTTSSLIRSIAARLQRFTEHHTSLRELDDRTLADIGIDPSEIGSIEAEWHGASALTRLRIAQQPRHA